LYDHTSILRFIEWRFLGAPAEGPGADGDTWFLTMRDRHASNIGASLTPDQFDPETHLKLPDLMTSPPCSGPAAQGEKHAFEEALEAGFFEAVGYQIHPGSQPY
jgi:hypothetical protein